MFTGFDFGKSLMKQVEAFKRLPPSQQPRREAALVHQIDAYVKNFLRVVSSPGAANPGLLKNAAEALLEAAVIVKESQISYMAFAELVARSRKVPVVPGLASLVDKLLEIPTELKAERIGILNWRISNGNLKPDKHLAYLAERAKLTGEAVDWKDYAYSLGQLIKKGSIAKTDDVAFAAYEELVANKGMLGDRAAGIQLQYTETLIERKAYRQAEQNLIALMAEAKQLPENYSQVVIALIDVKPDASWELHQAGLTYLLASYADGKTSWSQLLSRIERTSSYTRHLVDFLLNSSQLARDEKLIALSAERIMALDEPEIPQYLERWRIVLAKAGVAPPEMALEIIERGARSPEGLAVLRSPLDLEALAAEEAAAEAERASSRELESAATDIEVTDDQPEADETAKDEDFMLSPDELVVLEPAANGETAATTLESQADEEQTEEAEEPETELEVEEPAMADEAGDSEVEPTAVIEEEPADEGLPATEEQPVEEELAAELEPDELEAEPEPEAAVEEIAAELEETVAEPVPVPAATAIDWAALDEPVAVHDALAAWAGNELTEDQITELGAWCSSGELAGWQVLETRLWLANQLIEAGAVNTAAAQLEQLPEVADAEAAQVAAQISKMFAHAEPPPSVQAQLGSLALSAGDYPSVLSLALALPEADPARVTLLDQLQERILELADPGAGLIMLQAQARRAAVHDPMAGFDAATTASLMALDDPAIQEAYASWASLIPAATLHRQRAQQAAFLSVHHVDVALLKIALDEIEALELPEEAQDPEVVEWLEQLRPMLDLTEADEQEQLLFRWTRLYLKHIARAGRPEQVPELLTATAQLLRPEDALSLISELAAVLGDDARRTLEVESYLRQGAWDNALDTALGGSVATAVPVQQLCEHMPEEALASSGHRLSQALSERGDDASRLDLVRYLGERLGGNGDSEHLHPLRDELERLLSELCDRKYEPAVRYRLEHTESEGDLAALAVDLLALAREGDQQACLRLEDVFSKLLTDEGSAKLLQDIAETLATASPELAIPMYARAGLATGEVQWAIGHLAGAAENVSTLEEARLLGELALSAREEQLLSQTVDRLREMEAHTDGLELVEAALAEYPDSDLMHMALIRLQLDGETRDLQQATSNLLRLAQLYQERGIRPREALEPLKPLIADVYNESKSDQDAQHLKLTILALGGELQEAAKLVQQIMLRGPQAADGLLSLFERLAMDDTDLPSPLLIAWGRALFRAGRVEDALNRLAGLREAVGDYPEYTELLEEIKAARGGPGACMQLGEAYLRVHLWQRSAEEYAAALALDPTLAEPVLTQLRHHSALDPNPMKYPLHLLGLRAVAGSSRPADWGWALSALTWLIPRWSAEELFGLATRLWDQHHRGELEPSQREELLHHLSRLAHKLGRAEDALTYLRYAWEAVETPGPELLAMLAELEQGQLPTSLPLLFTFRRYQTEAAVLRGGIVQVIESAQQLAAVSPEGRIAALEILAAYQATLGEPMPVMLARLRLLDLGNVAERDTFIHELLQAAAAGLPQEQVRSLISTVLELIREAVESPELTQLLMLLFRQMGDQARAWELALCCITGSDGPVPTALETLNSVAADEYALRQRVAIVAVHVLREEYEPAANALEQLNWSNLGELASTAAMLAETLLASPAAATARRWLIGHYRDAGELTLAADHLVWAHAAGNPQPAEWLNEQRNADLLYRAGQLYELNGNLEAARRAYQRATETPAVDQRIAASVHWRLSELEEAAGRLEQAHEQCAAAFKLAPELVQATARLEALNRAIAHRQIGTAREAEDTPARTVEIVQLLRGIGEINAAIAELQGAVGRGHNAPEVFIELAECFVETREYTIARRAYLEVLKRLEFSSDVELKLRALYGLAIAEEELGNVDEAAKYLEELLLMRRDYLDGKQRLDRLQTKRHQEVPERKRDRSSSLVDEILSLLGPAEAEDGARRND